MEPFSSLLLGALLASFTALPFRRADHRGIGALVSAAASAAAATWQVSPGSLWILFAFALGAALGWIGVGDPGSSLASRFGDTPGLAKASGPLRRAPRPNRLLDPASRLRLERAIYAAESSGSVEVVLALVERCDPYSAPRWRFALSVAACVLLAGAKVTPQPPIAALLLAQGAAFGLAFAATGWPPLLRLLLPRATATASVEARARRAFVEAGLHHAPGGAAALLLVASLERRFSIVADDGRAASADTEEWEAIGARLAAAFRDGNGVRGLEEAVGACAPPLARASHDEGARYRDLALLKAGVIVDDRESTR